MNSDPRGLLVPSELMKTWPVDLVALLQIDGCAEPKQSRSSVRLVKQIRSVVSCKVRLPFSQSHCASASPLQPRSILLDRGYFCVRQGALARIASQGQNVEPRPCAGSRGSA